MPSPSRAPEERALEACLEGTLKPAPPSWKHEPTDSEHGGVVFAAPSDSQRACEETAGGSKTYAPGLNS